MCYSGSSIRSTDIFAGWSNLRTSSPPPPSPPYLRVLSCRKNFFNLALNVQGGSSLSLSLSIFGHELNVWRIWKKKKKRKESEIARLAREIRGEFKRTYETPSLLDSNKRVAKENLLLSLLEGFLSWDFNSTKIKRILLFYFFFFSFTAIKKMEEGREIRASCIWRSDAGETG